MDNLAPLDRLVTRLSLLDYVRRVDTTPELVVWVNCNVESVLGEVLGLVRKFAPGTHGEVRRVR